MKFQIPISHDLEQLAKNFHEAGAKLFITGQFVQQNIKYQLDGTPFTTDYIELVTDVPYAKVRELLSGFDYSEYSKYYFDCAETRCSLERDICLYAEPPEYTLKDYVKMNFSAYDIVNNTLGYFFL